MRINNFRLMVIMIRGKVIKGDNIGKKQGYPTANLPWPKGKKLPKGIFAAKVKFNKKDYNGLVVAGIPSAVDGKPKMEVHILDFNKIIYGQWLMVTVIKKIRNLRKFKSQKKLLEAIQRDCEKAREILTDSARLRNRAF